MTKVEERIKNLEVANAVVDYVVETFKDPFVICKTDQITRMFSADVDEQLEYSMEEIKYGVDSFEIKLSKEYFINQYDYFMSKLDWLQQMYTDNEYDDEDMPEEVKEYLEHDNSKIDHMIGEILLDKYDWDRCLVEEVINDLANEYGYEFGKILGLCSDNENMEVELIKQDID